jgi:serine/threonine protein kinase
VTDEVGPKIQAAGVEYVCRACREQESFNALDLFDQLLGAATTEKSVSGAPSIEGYQILEKIAKGGMGLIYKAVSQKTGQPVAVKTMLPQVATHPENVQTFQREIDVTRQLKHPHIVRLIEHGKSQGIFYFILDGPNLDRLIHPEGPLSLKEAAPIMLGTLDGLAYAHRATITTGIAQKSVRTYQGVVHRDLKPENILLTRKGERWFPKITDFGISKSFESAGFTNLTVAGDVLGTPMYWPREQITHYKYLNPATDVFSIAAVFYEMLTGRWVRDGFKELLAECEQDRRFPTIPDYMRVITGNPAIPIRDINPAIPEPIAKLLDRALQEAAIPHNEEKMQRALAELRYPDAGVFRDALIKALHEIGASDSVMLTHSYHQDPVSPQKVATPAMPRAGQGSTASAVAQPRVSQEKAWEDIFQDFHNEETPQTGDAFDSTAQVSTSTQEVALFVLDMVQSTQFVLDFGDTYFSTFIGNIHRTARKHAAASDMIFIKSTGDGLLAAFKTMSAALSLASTFLETHAYQDIDIRMALHWGAVRIGPGGDVLGKEVNRVSRLEGVKVEDRIKPTGKEAPLPLVNRLLISRQG